MLRLSTLIVSGMVRMILYPLDAAMAARPIPVFPEVGSIIVDPFFNAPVFSASSIIALAIRSFTLPAGLKYSSFSSTVASSPSARSIFSASRRGVFPIRSKMLLLIFAIIILLFCLLPDTGYAAWTGLALRPASLFLVIIYELRI